jgi:hypothetical protein
MVKSCVRQTASGSPHCKLPDAEPLHLGPLSSYTGTSEEHKWRFCCAGHINSGRADGIGFTGSKDGCMIAANRRREETLYLKPTVVRLQKDVV